MQDRLFWRSFLFMISYFISLGARGCTTNRVLDLYDYMMPHGNAAVTMNRSSTVPIIFKAILIGFKAIHDKQLLQCVLLSNYYVKVYEIYLKSYSENISKNVLSRFFRNVYSFSGISISLTICSN